ncbi:MAG: hypothetical protein R3A12_16705 [Ignavibacteria bacterium]
MNGKISFGGTFENRNPKWEDDIIGIFPSSNEDDVKEAGCGWKQRLVG